VSAAEPGGAGAEPSCCPHFHEAIELIGRRWTGAILAVLLDGEPLRFGQLAAAVPDLSDRMLTERLKELEQRGLIRRHEGAYALTQAGRGLEPAVEALQHWARRWLAV
jgi:DNA-binding HxlR family transcriptional regulator